MKKAIVIFALLTVNLSYLNAENTMKMDGNTVLFYNDAKVKVATQTLDEDGNVASTDGTIPNGRIAEYSSGGKLVAEYQFDGGLKDGMTKLYYETGKLRAQIAYSKGKKQGAVKYFYENGSPMVDFAYENGEREGNGKSFDKNGKLLWEGQYKGGFLHGTFKRYYENGKPAVVENYAEGKVIDKKVYDGGGTLMKEKIIPLYKEQAVDVLPQSISEYGGGKFLSISKLTLSREGTSGSFQLNSTQEINFILAIYVETPNLLLASYKDAEEELMGVYEYSGGVTPLFSMSGFKAKGSGRGKTIEFSVPVQSGNLYDVRGTPKTITIFCLEGSVNAHYFPDGNNGVFDSISNVLTSKVK